jgi:hypothetical protein
MIRKVSKKRLLMCHSHQMGVGYDSLARAYLGLLAFDNPVGQHLSKITEKIASIERPIEFFPNKFPSKTRPTT